ncbi:MAG: hypothetical protein HYT75_02220 [Deltaproteobacteria bacterium]|nr:hypothetical protein [Deltaproteobacteria bacterium]MBI2342227.1 hypothetical protein [Deltaproteobacteria bacterium]
MARQEENSPTLIVEHVQEGSQDSLLSKHPMVLSCGGIYIPRPKAASAADGKLNILNVANTKEPTKVIGNGIPMNLLQEVLHKESMN